ncbi:hybrid sensor histidine kinase/response regulator [Massilia sp. GCM10023247]|uniref:hybrid sensor histidine kinase/response regulator n=1 Tax=Massilia sp. GCM10023247 TaxID=3252643 RepID=UPI003620C7D5
MRDPINIILVDDNPDDRALVERELKLRIEAVAVRHVSDAAGLQAALDEGRFDVAVTDYRLRWTLGTEVLRAIKLRYPQVPVIMFTGSGNEEVAVDAMKEGLDDYITKTPKHYPRVPYAVLGCFERATNRARLQESLARESMAKARLEIALQSAGMGTWQYDPESRQLAYSDDIGPMFGQARAFTHDSLDAMLDQVQAGDRAALRAALDDALATDGAFAIEFRADAPDGRVRSLAVSAKVIRNDPGAARLVIGTARDVSADVAAKETQRKQQEELQTILDVLPVGIAISRDAQARHVTTTPYLAALLGAEAGADIGTCGTGEHEPYRYFRSGEPMLSADWPMRVAARLGAPVRDEELEVRFRDGRALTLLVNAAPLLDRQGEVRGAVAALMDVSALKQIQRELEELNRQKSEFLSILAHELRNPMAAIGYSVEMLRHVGSPAAIDKAREVIARQTGHMGRLLDDLLDLSRITLNRIDLALKPVDMRRVIELAWESARAQFESLDHKVAFELAPVPALVLGDEVRLTQVMSNLLNNAAKFTPAGGTVTVGAALEAGQVVVTVSDNGVGIDPAQLERVFEMFSQAESKVSGGSAGLGIGLALVRKLVGLHGGTVRAFSDGTGHGTTLRVALPLAEGVEEPAQASAQAASSAEIRLLVADDNADAVDLLAEVLRIEGYSVVVAHDGREAMARAEEWQPHALILDIGMPHANGLEVARWVRAQAWGKEAILIAVTGWGQQQDRMATSEAGFDVHLVKPVNPHEIMRTLGLRLTAAYRAGR